MVTECGRYALVFNGEIYNFRALRRELEQSGVRFKSTGDSEVVLQALIAWGADALSRFNGIFALAFYDSNTRRLLLARDHAGIKPLYVLRARGGIMFASQYDQLLAHPWADDQRVSQDALGLYLRFAFIPAPFGVLENTQMLEPGTWLEFEANGNARQGRHFRLPKWVVPSLRGEDAVDAVDSAVDSAVRRQLVSDVPVGAFLSGGIDSPLVVSKMCGVASERVRAFTIGTNDPRSDETFDAEAYARELGVAHTIETVTEDRARALVNDAIDACGEPFGDYSVIPTLLVSRLAARDFKVVLSGDGGDELFWGYVRRMVPMIQSAPDFDVPYALRAPQRPARRLFGAGGIPDYLRWPSLGHMQVAKHTHLPGTWLKQVFPRLPAFPNSYHAFDFSGSDPDAAAQWLRWNEFVCHLTMVLLKVDRASMFHSLEVRVPLLDREVIETALQVDWRACLDMDKRLGKLPLRRALARAVSHQTSAKRGFEVPMGQWLRTSLRACSKKPCCRETTSWDSRSIESRCASSFELHLNGSHDFAWGLWPLLSLALWEQRHMRGGRRGGRMKPEPRRAA